MTAHRRIAGHVVQRVFAALALAGAAQPALSETLGQGGGTHVAWWRVVGALLLCLVLAVAAAAAMKMRMRGPAPPPLRGKAWSQLFGALGASAPIFGRQGRRLQLIETFRLNQQVDVCLFQCDGLDFLIAATPQGVVVLTGANALAASAPTPK